MATVGRPSKYGISAQHGKEAGMGHAWFLNEMKKRELQNSEMT
jgi:hypothetical protein